MFDNRLINIQTYIGGANKVDAHNCIHCIWNIILMAVLNYYKVNETRKLQVTFFSLSGLVCNMPGQFMIKYLLNVLSFLTIFKYMQRTLGCMYQYIYIYIVEFNGDDFSQRQKHSLFLII